MFGTDRLGSISVQATPPRNGYRRCRHRALLRREHKIPSGEPSDFHIRRQATLLGTFQETTHTFSFLLAGIAATSLLVGGIGIMNIMLVSVPSARGRSASARRSARARDILTQFLIEALVL